MERLFNEEQQLKNSFPLLFKAFPKVVDAGLHFVTDFKNLSKDDLKRQFPMFLKEQKYSPEIFSLAQYEYLMGFVTDAEVLNVPTAELKLNSSFEAVALAFDYPQINLQKGLYAFFKTKSESLCIIKLSPDQARILDLMNQDFSWTKLSLTNCLEEAFKRTPNFWFEEINRLIELGVLL